MANAQVPAPGTSRHAGTPMRPPKSQLRAALRAVAAAEPSRLLVQYKLGVGKRSGGVGRWRLRGGADR